MNLKPQIMTEPKSRASPPVSPPADAGNDALSLRFHPDAAPPRAVVKDNVAIAGFPTTMGSARFAGGAPAEAHAEVVRRLLVAGVALAGRAKMHELAYGVTGRNDWAGTPRNPAWPERIVGGSSSGCAAAVATGMVDFAIGTDTGGSIRMPATCCGIMGFKPSFGLIDRSGVLPGESSLDCLGPMARTVAGIEQAMAIIADGFERQAMPTRPRVAVIDCDTDADVGGAFTTAISAFEGVVTHRRLELFDRAFDAGLTIIGAEMWHEFAFLSPDFRGIGDDVAQRLRRAATIGADQVSDAETIRSAFTAEVDALLDQADFLLLPALPCVPPLIADAEDPLAQLRLTRLVRPFNLSGHPVLSLPLRTAQSLPAGIQIVGRTGADAAVCAFGRLLEQHLASIREMRT